MAATVVVVIVVAVIVIALTFLPILAALSAKIPEIPILGTNAKWSEEGEFMVAEGDESDGTLARGALRRSSAASRPVASR